MIKHYDCTGNTPTSVGKTQLELWPHTPRGKHPHERGEDSRAETSSAMETETPPRAWGRRTHPSKHHSAVGNTPTSVGKTFLRLNQQGKGWKHPHERGEDCVKISALTCSKETPPRAWGRRPHAVCARGAAGNTPTSVGKTLDFTGVDGGLVEIRFVALSVFQSQGACLKFQ